MTPAQPPSKLVAQVETGAPTPDEVRQMPLSRRTQWLRRHFDFRPRKSLGQNFLRDGHVATHLAQAAAQFAPQRVIEIGPGLGALTVPLAESNWDLVAFESDRRLCEVLHWLFSDCEQVEIRQGDFLAADLTDLAGPDSVVVGNLPYYITTPILEKVFETHPGFAGLVITVQQEVAERIRAQPGTKQYGSLTIFCRYYAANIERLTTLPPQAFWPSPQVSSAALRLTLRAEPPDGIESETAFFAAVRGAFAHRRKTLRNSLKTATLLELSAEQVEALLTEAGIDGSRRGETLDFGEFVSLGNALHDIREGT